MPLIFTITLIFINVTLFSQQNLGLKLNAGISRISNSFYPHMNPKPDWPVRVAPSGQIGLFYYFGFGEKSILGAELIFNQIEGMEKLKLRFTDRYGNSTLWAIDHTYTHISYLSLPVYYGFVIKKLSIHFGLQTSYALVSSGRSKGGSTDGSFKYDNKYDKLNIDKYDYGPRIGFDYSLSSKFSIDCNYYHGLNNIIKSTLISDLWKRKVRQLTVGIKYSLRTNEEKKEEKQ